ncbi:MAG: hypothetical protein ACI83B_002736 [Sediminicola sp.]|jgi:hypothetical protein
MAINKKYGYVRVSSKSQESNSSIEFQKQQLIQNGIQVKNIRVEVGSGANEIKNRPVFQKLMEEELKPPSYPYITVSKLTDNIIRAAIQEFIDTEEDSYWLKLYHMTATLKIEDINEILDRKEKENIELEAEIDVEIEAENINRKIYFDPAFHRQLAKHFPDWSGRMAFQKKQEGFYKSAMQKKREALRLRLKENFNRTSEEQDAVDYFNGTGIYAKFQDIKTKPNIFDTRQSFLRKMHDDKLRNDFLNTLNRRKN